MDTGCAIQVRDSPGTQRKEGRLLMYSWGTQSSEIGVMLGGKGPDAGSTVVEMNAVKQQISALAFAGTTHGLVVDVNSLDFLLL